MNSTEAAVVTLSKSFVQAGRSFMSENDLTKMIEEYALRDRRDGETPAKAFSRVFTANTAEGALFRKAIAVAKAMPFGNDDEAAKAYMKLTKLADQERAATPHLTEAQAFSKAFRENPELAVRAVR